MVIRRPLSALAGGNVCSIAAGQQQNGAWLFLRLSRLRGSIGRLRRPSSDKNAEAKLRLWGQARRVGALSASSLAERAPASPARAGERADRSLRSTVDGAISALECVCVRR